MAKNGKTQKTQTQAQAAPVATPAPIITPEPAPAVETAHDRWMKLLPPGMDPTVWAGAEAAATAMAEAQGRTGAKTETAKKPAFTELTPETAKTAEVVLTLKVKGLDVRIVRTAKDKEIYSFVWLGADGTITKVEAAHDDRVDSPRHLPRAIRLLGSWVGDQTGFSNGAKTKTEAK